MNYRSIALLPLFFLGLFGAGCSDSSQSLHIHRDFTSESYFARFDRAIFTTSTDGQTDLILIGGGAGSSESAVDTPLSTRNGSLQQIMHIHALWQQPRSIRDDNPAARNGKISWHVMTAGSDRVIYSGSCWARIDIDGDTATFDLRNASISIARVIGSGNDPLKRASFDGKIEATRADSLVRSYIDDLTSIEASESVRDGGAPERKQVNP